MPTKVLLLAACDLKDRYSLRTGNSRLTAYTESIISYRRVKISFQIEGNGTAVKFTFSAKQDEELRDAQQDIQGELCTPEAHKKYRDPPAYLPSEENKVSKKSVKEMSKKHQKQIQPHLQKGVALTVDALEKHDIKHATGPCELRQFGCPMCQHSWWRNVLKSKPVSRCREKLCGNQRYDALPREKEFGIGRCLCPNDVCGREFYVYCEALETFSCRKCKTDGCKPHIHPKWRKRSCRLNPEARPFRPGRRSRSASRENIGPQFYPVSQSAENLPYVPLQYGGERMVHEFSAMGISHMSDSESSESEAARPPVHQPSLLARRRRRKIFNASEVHVSTGGTMSTFLSQMDFVASGVEVDLDYGSDDDDEKVGVCKLECTCDNKYTVRMRMKDQARCYECGRMNNPLQWAPPRDIQGVSDAQHSCTRCPRNGDPCPNLI